MTAKKQFWFLAYAGIGLLALYIFFVNSIVLNVVQREQARQSIAKLQSAVNGLESRYVALSGTITLDLAHEKGFKDAGEAASFAYGSRTGVALTYRDR